MKFIIDAQLPRKLSQFLIEQGYDCIHTLDLPKSNRTQDIEINEISIAQKRIVISKDSDFYNSYLQKVEPYKLIYITVGNVSNSNLIKIFEKNYLKIFEEIQLNSVVEITRTSIITIL